MLDEFMAFSCARCLLCFIHFGLGGLKWVSLEPLSVVCFVPLWKNQFALTSHTLEKRERLRRPNCVLFCSAARVEKWTIPWGRSENEDEIRQMEIHVWQTAYIRWLISGKIVSTNSLCVQECGIFIFWKLEKNRQNEHQLKCVRWEWKTGSRKKYISSAYFYSDNNKQSHVTMTTCCTSLRSEWREESSKQHESLDGRWVRGEQSDDRKWEKINTFIN